MTHPSPLEAIFFAALAKGLPQERAAYLDEACAGDPDLRRRVEKMLAAQAQAGSFLEQPAERPGVTVDTVPPSETPGAVIAGRYKLLELIGEGGMGAVWIAEQTQPVRRKVALKLIKAGMDSRSVLARFEAERQALALMDHPNIAKVLDGGLTELGRPFFVMEYVKGVPITEYCDAARLTIGDRLQLFMQVCQAVQHAHQKGIIHRDLKPSNILVAPYDDKPVPKVIDFGLAKAMHQSLTERTLHTAHDSVLGTPLYMSPEQAQLNNLDVDTRSDIYSLGVVLYELLTGTTPLEKQRFKEAAWDEIRRLIREEDPPRPSARLSSTDTLPSIAAGRQIEPLRLTKLVRGELDWIVMKALEKDRNRRYETANGFAMDVQRYLADEAVLACPPSVGYRLRKVARKYRKVLVTSTAFVGLLIAGLVVSTWQAVRATSAVTAERRAKRIAENKEAETEAALEFVTKYVFSAARPEAQDGGLGRNVKLRQAVEAALPFVEGSFAEQPLVEARLRMTLGMSFAYLGDSKRAAGQLHAARTLYVSQLGSDDPATLSCMHAQANSLDATSSHGEALQLREEIYRRRLAKLGPDHPDTLASANSVARSEFMVGNTTEDIRLRNERAIRILQETLTVCRAKLDDGHPVTLETLSNLANSQSALGRDEEALRLNEQVFHLRQAKFGLDHPDTMKSKHNLAYSYRSLNRFAEALKLHEENLARRKPKLGPDHPDTLLSTWGVADNLVRLGRSAEAVPFIDEYAQRAGGRISTQWRLVMNLMYARLKHFANIKDAAACRTTAETWEELLRRFETPDYAQWRTAAAMHAVTALIIKVDAKTPPADRERRADEQAEQAMNWLKQLTSQQGITAEQLRDDKDFDALRERDDFKKLLAELEKK